MSKHVKSKKADFNLIEKLAKPYGAAGRTDSAALLIWFLETIFRLDEIEAHDAVCDKKHDAGIDALSVKDDQKELFLFQAKRKQSLPATLGDTDLKQFVGSLQQFQTEASVNKLANKTANDELRNLLRNGSVADKIAKGYKIRAVFVCNIAANDDAQRYLEHAEATGHQIDLWDLTRLAPVLAQLSRDWFINESVKLNVVPSKVFADGPKTNPQLVYAAIQARELVKMPGIDDTRIFAQNVRLGLGNTRVNNDILETVKNKAEHTNFLTFHNGLTIVSKKITLRGSKLTLEGYSVCNGCQSLLTFYKNRTLLTNALEVLVRIVKVGDDRKLAHSIAYRTNNQNAISLRDLSANDIGQILLKEEFEKLYGHDTCYVIKRGEEVNGRELHNEYAGRLLLAVYVAQPWSCHQTYRVFGDLENRIFSYDTEASHIRLVELMHEVVKVKIESVENERIQRYALTRFLILYLVAEILRLGGGGKALFGNPGTYLSTRSAKNTKQDTVVTAIKDLIHFVIIELNFFVTENGGDTYDYKSEFKSPKNVAKIRSEVLKAYQKDIHTGRMTKFVLPK